MVPRTISPLRISAEAAVPARLDMDKTNGPLRSLCGSGTASWYSPLSLETDMARASVEPVALERLLACSQFHRLPAHIDPLQADCGLSIRAPGDAVVPALAMGLAA